MTKKEVQKKVSQNGEPLDLSKFEWDEKTNTFSSNEDNLVLDFNYVDDCTFDTGSNCTFKTGSNCTFKTGSNCTLNTGSDCTFDTGFNCTFDTRSNCTFDTGSYCTFKTGSSCTFDTGFNCTFDTRDNCVVVRRDVYEIIEVPANRQIKLNGLEVKGFTYLDENKSIELSNGAKVSEKTIREALEFVAKHK